MLYSFGSFGWFLLGGVVSWWWWWWLCVRCGGCVVSAVRGGLGGDGVCAGMCGVY